MQPKKTSVYIVNEDTTKSTLLTDYLKERFKNEISIFVYLSDVSCLRMMHGSVNLVVFDYLHESGKYTKSGIDVRRSIKNRFPKTEVIMFKSNEDTVNSINNIRVNKVKEYKYLRDIVNKPLLFLDRVLYFPLKRYVSEFGIGKFALIFLMVFATMGALVIWVINMI